MIANVKMFEIVSNTCGSFKEPSFY